MGKIAIRRLQLSFTYTVDIIAANAFGGSLGGIMQHINIYTEIKCQ